MTNGVITMKAIIAVLLFCVGAGLLVAGCTTPTTQGPVAGSELVGNWTLGEMGLAGTQAPLTTFPQPITITFSPKGIIAGNGGCNNYQGSYTLPGTNGSFGRKITMGPIITTRMYCNGTSAIENTYFHILSNVTEYRIDNTTTLSMQDPVGSIVVFQRT
jgi:heat shock protein HslJ